MLLPLPFLFAKVWAIGYALVVLCFALGIAVVARPSGRKREKKSLLGPKKKASSQKKARKR